MPANQSLGVRGTCKIETAIREIDVAVGTVVLTPVAGGDAITLGPGDTKTFDPPQSGFDVFSPEGARYHLTYETDPVGTEEARRQGPQDNSSQPRRKRSNASRRTTATAASKKSASGKASSRGRTQKSGSRASKNASSNSGARKQSSTKSSKKSAKKKG